MGCDLTEELEIAAGKGFCPVQQMILRKEENLAISNQQHVRSFESKRSWV